MRKAGKKQQHTRHQMIAGPMRCYRIVYDLKPGDVFRFRARHKAVNVHKETVRAQTKNWSMNDLEDFPKGTHIVWTGADWLTPFGHFLPRRYWWSSCFMTEVVPVSIVAPRKIALNIFKEKHRIPVEVPAAVLPELPPTPVVVEKPVSFFDKIVDFFS